MSYASIKSNNDAIAYINDAIKEYRESIDKIKNDNENTLSDAIIENIENNIGYLSELIGNINSLNANISRAMQEKEERLAQAAREAEAAAAAAKNSSNNTQTNANYNKNSSNKSTGSASSSLTSKSSGNIDFKRRGRRFTM